MLKGGKNQNFSRKHSFRLTTKGGWVKLTLTRAILGVKM